MIKTNDWVQCVHTSGSPQKCLLMAVIGQAIQDIHTGFRDTLYDDPVEFISDMLIDGKDCVYVTMIQKMLLER